MSNNSLITKEMPLSLRNCSVQRHCPSQHYRWANPQIRSHATMVWSESRCFLSEHSEPPACLERERLPWVSLASAAKQVGPRLSLGLIVSWFFSPGTLFSFCTPVAKPHRKGQHCPKQPCNTEQWCLLNLLTRPDTDLGLWGTHRNDSNPRARLISKHLWGRETQTRSHGAETGLALPGRVLRGDSRQIWGMSKINSACL